MVQKYRRPAQVPPDQKLICGAGERSTINQAAVYARFSALNRTYNAGEKEE